MLTIHLMDGTTVQHQAPCLVAQVLCGANRKWQNHSVHDDTVDGYNEARQTLEDLEAQGYEYARVECYT